MYSLIEAGISTIPAGVGIFVIVLRMIKSVFLTSPKRSGIFRKGCRTFQNASPTFFSGCRTPLPLLATPCKPSYSISKHFRMLKSLYGMAFLYMGMPKMMPKIFLIDICFKKTVSYLKDFGLWISDFVTI
jgi:hypothetical protein